MDKQAREAREMTKQLKGKERLANFWYYYKWWVVAGIFILLIAAITIYEAVTTVDYDLYVSCYTEKGLSEESASRLEEELKKYTSDINGDGEVLVSVSNLAAVKSETDTEYAIVQTRLSSELAAGDVEMFIMDETYLDSMRNETNSDTVEAVIDLNDVPGFKDDVGYIQDNLYLVLKALYEREEGDSAIEAQHESASQVFDAVRSLISEDVLSEKTTEALMEPLDENSSSESAEEPEATAEAATEAENVDASAVSPTAA